MPSLEGGRRRHGPSCCPTLPMKHVTVAQCVCAFIACWLHSAEPWLHVVPWGGGARVSHALRAVDVDVPSL